MSTDPQSLADDFPIGPLSPALRIGASEDATRVAIVQGADGRHFRLPLAALELLRAIPAPMSAAAFVAAQPPGQRKAVLALLRRAVDGRLLEVEAQAAVPAPEPARPGGPLMIHLLKVDPARMLALFAPLYRLLFTRTALALWAIASVVTIWQCIDVNALAWPQFAAFKTFHNWPWIYLMMVISSVMHEMGHAYSCTRHGEKVRELSIVLYFFQLSAYVNVSSSWLLPHKRQRVEIALAGLYVESFLALLAAQALIWLEPYTPPSEVAFIFLVVLLTRMVLNLVPVLRLDGYWVLSDLLGEPNLRQRATAYCLSRIAFWRAPRALSFEPRHGLVYVLFTGASLAFIGYMGWRALLGIDAALVALPLLVRLSVAGFLVGALTFSLVVYLRQAKQKYFIR